MDRRRMGRAESLKLNPQMPLRDYQEKAIDAIDARYRAGVTRQLLSAATGAGKTEIFAYLIKEKIAAGENCLVLAHRDRLVTQAAGRIEGIVGFGKVSMVNADRKNWWSPCVVATVQSAAIEKQLTRAPRFQNIIVDECHRSNADSYKRVIDALLAPGGLLLGVTATPNRTDKKGLIPQVYQELVYEIGMQQLIDEGYLSKVTGKEIKLPIDFSKIKTQISTDGIRDYKPEEIKAAFEEANWLERITEGWREVASDRRTIIFVPPGVVDGRGCGMAHSLAEYMRLHGIAAAAVDGTTKQGEQDRVIADFTSGATQVLVNVNIFTEGLDIPPIDCVLFARPTQSSIIYSQAIGRGTRLFPGKENLLVVDVTGITEQLAKDGQSLMTLGRILPTEEQVLSERAERRQRAKRLLRKLWLKRVTLKVVDDRIEIRGQVGPKYQREIDDLEAEIKEILTARDEASAEEEARQGERRPVNTSLLLSDKIEIREIDFERAAMRFDWDINRDALTATLWARGKYGNNVFYEIRRSDPASPYFVETFSEYGEAFEQDRGSDDALCETFDSWHEAKAFVERFLAERRLRQQKQWANPNAPWRSAPMTDRQREILNKFRIPYGADCTKGEASELIDAAFRRRKKAG